MLWVTRYAVNVDLSIVPEPSRHRRWSVGAFCPIPCESAGRSATWLRHGGGVRGWLLPVGGGGLLGREVPAMPTFVTLAKWTDEGP